MNWVNNWLSIIPDCLLPATCVFCGHTGEAGSDLCRICRANLKPNWPCCPQCALSLPPSSPPALLCGRCLNRRPAFDNTYAPYIYDDAMRYLVTHLKFGAAYPHARLLGQLLASHVQHHAALPERLLPVPLHPGRYQKRGFNQALEIARTVGKTLDLPLDLETCQRRLDTPQQSRLAAKQRRSNIKNAFAVSKPPRAKHIALVDDVMTTGATLHELAKTLKKAGVEKVDVWVCARA